MWNPSRRQFITALTALAGTYAIPARAGAVFSWLYPPMDLSYFDKPVTAAAADIKLGYAAITWGGNDRQAIEDISALGFAGIQLRSNVLKEIPNPEELEMAGSGWSLLMMPLRSKSTSPTPNTLMTPAVFICK